MCFCVLQRDIHVLKQLFVSVYMSSVYPLLYSAEMPAPCWADEEVESQRARFIYSPSQKTSVGTMLSSQCTHEAFDITQVTYDLITSAQHWHSIEHIFDKVLNLMFDLLYLCTK